MPPPVQKHRHRLEGVHSGNMLADIEQLLEELLRAHRNDCTLQAGLGSFL